MIEDLKFDSVLIRGADVADGFGAAVTPIYQASTFRFKNADQGAACFAGEDPGFIYTRIGNPTISAMENVLAKLENGYSAIGLSSGMAAVNTVYMALLNAGDHIVSTDAVYSISRVVMEKHWSRFNVESTYVDTIDPANIEPAIKPNTKMLFLETPSNPTMGITDLKAAIAIAKKHRLTVVVDNTICSPVLQKPLDLGADISLHSLTKFISGHADIVGGVIVCKNKEMDAKIRPMMVQLGCNMDPTQAYMVIRGFKTLTLRVLKQQENAQIIAEWLEKHPKIEKVFYPGLKSHAQYQIGQEQMSGPGSVMSFEVKGGINAGKILMDHVRLILLAVSMGGVESLISHPASMTHCKMDAQARLSCGITDGLVRFAVGIEDVNDLIADLDQALTKI